MHLRPILAVAVVTSLGCAGPAPSVAPPAAPPPVAAPVAPPPARDVVAPANDAGRPSDAVAIPELDAKPLPLPDAKPPAFLDYLAVDRAAGKVYVPEGSTGSLDVLDVATSTFQRVSG